jgi:hypothetical protein
MTTLMQIGHDAMIDVITYNPVGDKKNSNYFNEYRIKIIERRKASGIDELIGDIAGIVTQVQSGDAFAFLQELYAMTPYRFRAGYISNTHKIYCLVNNENSPAYFVIEPLDPYFVDDITRINKLYPNAREKFNARYVGEILKSKDKDETKSILISHNIMFRDPDLTENKLYCDHPIHFTRISDLTYNCIGYTDNNIFDFDSFEFGQPFSLTKAQATILDRLHEFSVESGLKNMLKGIDHLATRILAGEREDAILEYLCLSSYYFWGAYNITDMNSSTNVTRVLHGDDIRSPAKVFTANNTPYMINSFENQPMPTETFVRNYGRRLHHIAFEVIDGDHPGGGKNIDYVVKTLKDKSHIKFLAKVFGECKDVPDLEQIFSTHSSLSLLITEYVERCHGFDGFFTKENVAALTAAAGMDEALKAHNKKSGMVGD